MNIYFIYYIQIILLYTLTSMTCNKDNSGGNRQTEHKNGQTHLFFLLPSQRGEEQGQYDVITDLLRAEDHDNNNNNDVENSFGYKRVNSDHFQFII